MRKLAVIALAGSAVLATSISANADSRNFEVTGFDRIDVATGLDARVSIGEDFAVVANSNSGQALDNLEISVDGGILTARLEQSFLDFIISGGLVGMLLNSGNAVSIDITLPALAGATASSGADVDLSGIRGDTLELDASSGADIFAERVALGTVTLSASSGADIEVGGTAITVNAAASSGADIDASDLHVETAKADASSGAGIELHVSNAVVAKASSGASIDIEGNPITRDVDASSGGDVDFDD